jgi:hypothetical protein
MKVLKTLINYITALVALSFVSCNGNPSPITGEEYVGERDTLKLLTNNRAKFWDIIKYERYPNNHTGQYLNWMFSSNMRFVEYTYKNQKRVQHAYTDVIIARFLAFEILNDTLIIKEPLNQKYLINKLNSDSLIVSHFGQFGLETPIRFKRSKNQKEL